MKNELIKRIISRELINYLVIDVIKNTKRNLKKSSVQIVTNIHALLMLFLSIGIALIVGICNHTRTSLKHHQKRLKTDFSP